MTIKASTGQSAVLVAPAGESDLKVGIVACLQTHRSLANWPPRLHL